MKTWERVKKDVLRISKHMESHYPRLHSVCFIFWVFIVVHLTMAAMEIVPHVDMTWVFGHIDPHCIGRWLCYGHFVDPLCIVSWLRFTFV